MARAFAVAALSAASVSLADTVRLKDGTTIEGSVKRQDSQLVITAADGSVRNVAADQVKSITLGNANRNESAAEQSLASLRRSVDALNDLDAIIARYQKFLEANKDATAAAEADADLAGWQQKKTENYTKHGRQWVPAVVVGAMVGKANDLAAEARDQLRTQHARDAENSVQQALALDPQNAAALYLQGVMLFRSDKIPEARKAFESVNTAQPNHPPTLNNLAVIRNKQNATMVALNFYDQAMQAAGVNRFILDNVAQALGVLSDDQKKSQVAVKCLKRFQELDTLLQQMLGQQGLYRWGGGWVNQKQLDDLKATESATRDQITALQTQFDQTQARIAAIDSQVTQNNASIADILARFTPTDSKGGTPVSTLLPGVYYDLQRQNGALAQEKLQLQQKIPQMQDQAKQLQQNVLKPPFSGIQQLVGVEGMPEITPSAGDAATNPSDGASTSATATTTPADQ